MPALPPSSHGVRRYHVADPNCTAAWLDRLDHKCRVMKHQTLVRTDVFLSATVGGVQLRNVRLGPLRLDRSNAT
jgi:hypothetical protein